MPLPIPNLDTKDFDAYFQEARAALPAQAPKWTEYNPSDPGITLIELFAWLSDINTYRLNRIDGKHILKYLKLLDASPKPVVPAKCLVTFESNHKEEIKIAQNSELLAVDETQNISIPFVTLEALSLHRAKPEKIMLKNERGFLTYEKPFPPFFYPFGQLAKEGHCFEVTFDHAIEGDFSLTFIFYEEDLPPKGFHAYEKENILPSALLEWEYKKKESSKTWQSLKIMKDNTNSFSQNGTIFFQPQNKVKIIRCKIKKEYFENAPRIQRILTNTTEAVQIKKVEELLEEKGSGLPHQRMVLKESPLTGETTVKVTNEIWHETDTLQKHTYDEKVYQVDKNKGVIIFGDGIRGAIPPLDANTFCTYTTSKGSKGNIAQNLTWAAPYVASNISITNPFIAAGGEDPQTVKEAYMEFHKDFRTPYQAVTAKDFEYLAIHTPGLIVARAKALVNKVENKVSVIVLPFSFNKLVIPTESFRKTVCFHLDKHRLITTKVEVIPPFYTLVSVRTTMTLKEGGSESTIRKNIQKAVEDFLDPIRGWKDHQGWPFGQAVYKSDIYALLGSVDGVKCVAELTIEGRNHCKNDLNGDIILDEDALTSSDRVRILFSYAQEVCRSTL